MSAIWRNPFPAPSLNIIVSSKLTGPSWDLNHWGITVCSFTRYFLFKILEVYSLLIEVFDLDLKTIIMCIEKFNYTLVCGMTCISCLSIYTTGCHVLHIKSWAAEVLGFSWPLLGLPWHKCRGAWALLEITAGLREFLPSTVGKCYCEQETEILKPISIYRVSQEECARLQESVPYVKVYRYNPKRLYPKLNGYGDNDQRKVRSSCGSTYCTFSADTLHVLCACRWDWNAVNIMPACPCKVLGTLRTTTVLMRVFM